MVIGLVMSTAAMLYVARSARDDSDALWFVKAYFAVFRPIILAPGSFDCSRTHAGRQTWERNRANGCEYFPEGVD